MQIPVPSAEETRANAAFAAILGAMSRPGLPRELPDAGAGSLVEALIDRECRVFCPDPALGAQILRSGAALVGAETADHLFAGELAGTGLLGQIRCGSDLHPEEGATLVAEVRIGAGPALHLTGPGIDGELSLRLGGLPEGFWPARKAAIRYPTGFDLLLIDGPHLVGIPRSTAVEVC